jgi:predicted GIY-YIG superfamily endonuclease
MFWVYILQCSDNSFYTGHTDDLEKRINEHIYGLVPSCYTYNRRPIKLLFSQEFNTREEALASEQQIKGWSRKKKEALINGDWEKLKHLSKKSVRGEPVEP